MVREKVCVPGGSFWFEVFPHYSASVMLQVAKELRHQGVCLHVFYDDILIVGSSKAETHRGVLRTLYPLYALGLTVNFDKSELSP